MTQDIPSIISVNHTRPVAAEQRNGRPPSGQANVSSGLKLLAPMDYLS